MPRSRYFRIEGIRSPGRVNVLINRNPMKFGEVKLFDLNDEQLWRIYKAGECPYIFLTEAGYKKYFPSKKIISNEKIINKGNPFKEPAKKTTIKSK